MTINNGHTQTTSPPVRGTESKTVKTGESVTTTGIMNRSYSIFDKKTTGMPDEKKGNTSVKPIRMGNNPNSCGTTSLAMILNSFGKKVTSYDIDKIIRQGKLFVTPTLIQEAASKYGLNSAVLNNSNFEEIKEHIDKNHRIMVFVDSKKRRKDLKLHCLVIKGYQNNNGQKMLTLINPSGGKEYKQSYEEFIKKRWSDADVWGLDTGMNNLMVVFSEKNDLPKSRPGKKFKVLERIATGFVTGINALFPANKQY